jgi:glycosyl transferase family 25
MAKTMKGLATYVINLDRSPERMEAMRTRLAALGLPFIRVPARDGETLAPAPREVNARKYALAHGKTAGRGEIGCYLSHDATLREFIKSGAEFALIFEDDMEFAPDFKPAVAALLARRDWDVVKLNGRHGGGAVFARRVDETYSLVKELFHQNLSGAYLVNRRAAAAYAEKLLPMFVPYDHELVKYWKYGLRGFSLRPFPAREIGAASTIDYAKIKAGRLPWWRRIPTAFYRAGIATRRMVYVLFGA